MKFTIWRDIAIILLKAFYKLEKIIIKLEKNEYFSTSAEQSILVPVYNYIVVLYRGLALTIVNIFNGKVTLNYPLEKASLSPRFRGEHSLRRYANGEERCIACKLCEVVCPALAISIETDPKWKHGRKTLKYEIDMSKCIFCGYCQEACPVEAIVESNNYEYYISKRSQFFFKKSKLLANGLKWETELLHNIFFERVYR